MSDREGFEEEDDDGKWGKKSYFLETFLES